jgi:hypothetical protein
MLCHQQGCDMSDEIIRGRVEADVSGYKRGMDEAARSTEDFRKKAEATARGGLTTLQAVMGSLGRALPLVSGGMAGVALATVGLAKAAAGTAAEIGRVADALGVSAEEMSRYRYAARVVGVENSAMEGGLRSLRVAIETDSAALRAMGVATRDAAGAQRPLREVLGEVAERFALYEGGAAQAKLGTEVFGDSWKTLQPLIEKGRDGLAELTDEASTFGTVVDDEAAAAAQAFEEDVRRLQAALPGLAQELAGPVVSALGEVIEEFNAARRAGLSFIEMMGGTIFNEMADPTKSLEDRIGERKQDLRRLERGNWFELSWGERLNPFHSEDQLRKEVAWLERLETIQARGAATAEKRGAAAQAAGRAAADGALAAMTAEEEAERARERAGKESVRRLASQAREAQRAADAQARNAAALDTLIEKIDAEAVAEAARAVAEYNAAWAEYLNGLDGQRRGLEEQVELFGLTEAQIAAVTLRRSEETLAVARANGVAPDYLAALEREVELRRQIAGAAGTLEAKRANAEAAQGAAREWERTAQEIEGAIYDAIVSGGEDAGEVLERTFKALVLRPIIQPVAQAAAGVVTGALGLGGAGGSSGGSALGGAQNILSGINTVSSAFGLGSMAGFGSIAQAGVGGWLSASGSLIGTGTLGGIGAGVGMLAGPIGAAVGLASLLGAFEKKPSDKSAWATANPLTGALVDVGSMTGKKDPGQEARDAAAQLAQYLSAFAQDAGINRNLTVMTGARDGFRVDLAGGLRTPTAPRGNGGYGYNFGAVGEDAMKRILNDLVDEGTLPQATIDAWRQMRTDAAGVARDAQEQMDVLDLLTRGINQAEIERANTMQQAGETLAAAYARMVAVEESIRAAISAAFDTPEEQLTAAFDAIGVAIPQTVAAYEALVKAQDLTTEAGRNQAVALLNAKGVWDAVQREQEAAAEAARRAAEEARRAWEALRDDLSAFRVELTAGALAGLSPEAAYAAAEQSWMETSRLAGLGNQDALAQLAEAGRALLAASEAYNARTGAYFSDRDRVLSAVDAGVALTGRKIEGFANGGFFGGGLRIVGERGPELEATGAARYWSAQETRTAMGGGAEAVRELQAVVRVLSTGLSSIDRRLANLERSSEEQARAARLAADRRPGEWRAA